MQFRDKTLVGMSFSVAVLMLIFIGMLGRSKDPTWGDIIQAAATFCVGMAAWWYTRAQTQIASEQTNLERFREIFQAFKACSVSLVAFENELKEGERAEAIQPSGLRYFYGAPAALKVQVQYLHFWLPKSRREEFDRIFLRLDQEIDLLIEYQPKPVSEGQAAGDPIPVLKTENIGKVIKILERSHLEFKEIIFPLLYQLQDKPGLIS